MNKCYCYKTGRYCYNCSDALLALKQKNLIKVCLICEKNIPLYYLVFCTACASKELIPSEILIEKWKNARKDVYYKL